MDNIEALDGFHLCEEFSHVRAIGLKDPLVKKISDLINNKRVEDDNLFVIEGLWAYEKIIKSNAEIKSFIFCPEYIKKETTLKMVKNLISISESTYTLSNKLCKNLSSRDSSEGFFFICKMPEYKLDDIVLSKNNVFVILDGLEKPGNIGTIIRSVDGAGGDAVILCNRKIKRTNYNLIKASMGSSFIVPVIEVEIEGLAQWLQENGFKIVLTDLKAKENYINIDYSGRIAIVAGNEKHGISELWDSFECEKVIIPMLGGGADSLNVGIATTMVTYEASLRQKGMVKRIL